MERHDNLFKTPLWLLSRDKSENKRPSEKLFLHIKDDSGLDQLTFADGLEVECERVDANVICFVLLYAFQCFVSLYLNNWNDLPVSDTGKTVRRLYFEQW